MGGGGMGGPGGADQAGAGGRARLVFTIRMMKITISPPSPAKMSSTPPPMLATRLAGAAFADIGVQGAAGQTLACRALIGAAEHLAAGH
jgi:hypothetical protein